MWVAVVGLLVVACHAAPAARIVGGTAVASAASLPFQCALYDSQARVFLCGCSLISPSWVLTAASCLRTISATSNSDRLLAPLQVLLGSVRLSQPGAIFSVSRALIHSSWTFSADAAFRVNLAWVQLSATVLPYRSTLRPVQLATAAEHSVFGAAGVSVVVAGWGSTSATSAAPVFPDQLQQAGTAVSSAAECEAALAAAGQTPLGAGELCTPAVVCRGDVGGALVALVRTVSRQIGVVSRTTSSGNGTCGGTGVFAVYAAVGPHRDAIQSSIDEPLFDSAAAAAAALGAGLTVLILAMLL